MLKLMRMKGSTFLVWGILVLLIAGLAGFGIGDILRGGLTNTVARSGDVSVSTREYTRAMIRALRARANNGQPITMAEARESGFDRQVLAGLVQRAVLDAELVNQGLSVGDATVEAEIAKIPGFQGPDGKFSPEQARFMLDRYGYTEAELAAEIRSESAIALLRKVLTDDLPLPPGLLDTLLAYRLEQRKFAWIRLDAERFGTVEGEPTEEELVAWHKAHAEAFTTPETRVISYAALDPAVLAEGIEIPDEKVKAVYQADIEHYRSPERRSLQRLTFPSMKEAQEAKEKIEKGETTLLALAEARGFAEKDIDLGEKPASALDKPVADAVFALTEPGLAGPVETGLGPALFQVNAILAAHETPFEEAAPAIRKELALKAARDKANELAPQIDDLVAGGARVEEIAQETPFVLGNLELAKGVAGEGLAADPTFIETAEKAEKGVESDLAQAADGTYFVLRVDEIRPAALKPLDQVRDAVIAGWKLEKKRESTREKAKALMARIGEGATLAQIAAELGVTLAEAGPVGRTGKVEGVPARLIGDVFGLQPNGVALAEDDGAVYLAQLSQVISYDPASPEAAQAAAFYRAQLEAAYRAEVFDYYAQALQARNPTEIFPSAIESVLSRIR